MKTHRTLSGACAVLLLVAPAVSGAEPPPPPRLPLQTPVNACWIVRSSNTEKVFEPDSKPSPVADKTRFDQSREYVRIRAYEGDSVLSEYWIFKSGQTVAYPKDGTFVVSQVDERSIEADLAKRRYPELLWLAESNYRGVVRYQNRLCHHFSDVQPPVEAGGEQNEESTRDPSAFREAWIDTETKQPVAVRLGNTLRTYEFPSSPPDLQLGADMRRRLDEIDANRKAYDSRHAMP